MGTILNDVAGTGYANDYMSWLTANQISELRRDVPKAEADIKEAIHAEGRASAMEFCNVNKTIADNSKTNVIEILENRAAIKESQCSVESKVFENRYFLHDNILKSENAIIRALDSETDIIKERMSQFEARTAENFCDVKGLIKDNTRLVLERLTSDKIDEKNDEISKLRAKNQHWEQQLNFSNQQNKLESMINSIAQEQKFQSKVSQFGIGNVALPTQTANQG